MPANENLIGTFFGLGTEYDTGVDPSIALNGGDVAVEVHQADGRDKLVARVGLMQEGAVDWGPGTEYDSGIMPTVAVNDNRLVVELHRTERFNTYGLYYRVGSVDPARKSIQFGPSHKYDDGSKPSVALTNGGVVVEVHESSNRLNNKMYYHVGRVVGEEIRWGQGDDYDDGVTPSVAINESGLVVEVHKSQGSSVLFYRVGRINGERIIWGPSEKYQDGVEPSIALMANGSVIEVHTSEGLKNDLYQMSGRVEGNKIQWSGGAVQFDDGKNASVATNGRKALQVHKSEIFSTLWASNSLVMDRANWMGDHLVAQGDKTLRQIAIPASHDSGMFAGNILGKTQDESLRGQLDSGVRFFDLRVGANMKIAHGIVDGPPIREVLEGVRQFMNGGHRELAILKFSHYGEGFHAGNYQELARLIQEFLSPWLYSTPEWTGRFADATLETLLLRGGRVLVVSDGTFPLTIKIPGIYVYRDWDSEDPEAGDLTVFDQFADTIFPEKMRDDQLGKLARFNGRCQKNPNVPCDLFLLSWTLTPPTDVWQFSKPANRSLGDVMARIGPNVFGFVPNLLYVDYAQYARPADIVVEFNGRR